MHDRLILGGNTTIWGGHISFRNITKKIKKNLSKKIKFHLKNFPLMKQDPFQMKEIFSNYNLKKKSILDVKDIPIRIQNGFINNIQIQKGKLYI